MALTITIFGGTGDLAKQKLFPALLQLSLEHLLPDNYQIIAIGRRNYNNSEFREIIKKSLEKDDSNNPVHHSFLEHVHYHHMDFQEREGYTQLRELIGDSNDHLCYLSVDPGAVPGIVEHLAQEHFSHDKGGWFRLILEKPFGYDLESAQTLDHLLCGYFEEEQLYRVDHYLAKETVQNLLTFRFANGIFEPLWNHEFIDHIQITIAEEAGIGTRGAFYDQTGAVRDFLQNHLLQLVSLLTMEEPCELSFDSLRDATVGILEQTKINPDTVIYGQYTGYQEEDRVTPQTQTETYVMATLGIESDRWQGVPIYVRTGKKLSRRISEITIQFKQPTSQLFAHTQPRPNLLIFRLQPDEGMQLEIVTKRPKFNMDTQSVIMEFCYATVMDAMLPTAYERVFADVIKGDRTLSLSNQVIEASWRLIDPVLAKKKDQPLHIYTPKTWGPEEADAILKASGRQWYTHESTVCNAVHFTQ